MYKIWKNPSPAELEMFKLQEMFKDLLQEKGELTILEMVTIWENIQDYFIIIYSSL